MSAPSPTSNQHRDVVTCYVKGCKEYGRPRPLPVGMKALPSDHPDSHYSQQHADPADVTPRHRFNADGTRK